MIKKAKQAAGIQQDGNATAMLQSSSSQGGYARRLESFLDFFGFWLFEAMETNNNLHLDFDEAITLAQVTILSSVFSRASPGPKLMFELWKSQIFNVY